MSRPELINLSALIDDAKCYELVRQLKWPNGVCCPRCGSSAIARDGRDERQQHQQRYRCKACRSRFDDLSGTVLANHHQPLRVWILCLYYMGLNLSNLQIAKELDLNESDIQSTATQLRSGVVAKLPEPILEDEVEADEMYIVAGNKGNPAAVKKRPARTTESAEGGTRAGQSGKGEAPSSWANSTRWRSRH